MRIFEIMPKKQVGLLEFGMDRLQVRKIMGNFVEFKKSKFSKNTTDDFSDCHAFYHQDNTLKALEIFPEAQVSFDQKNLFELNLVALKDLLFKLDNELEVNGDGLSAKALGLNVAALNGEIESILVFGEDYYKK